MFAAARWFVLGLGSFVILGCAEGAEDDAAPMPGAPTVTVLAQGPPLRGTNGITLGPDGRLWIASLSTPALAAMDPETGEIIETLGPKEGPKGPDDLAFGPDGSVYWTDLSIGEVGKRTPEGVNSVVARVGPGVNPITFSDDGRLFVSQCFLGSNLYEVDPTGKKEPRLISDQLGPRCGLNGMDWGPDGQLYGPRFFRHEVVRVNIDTGEFTTVAEGFKVPAAVKFDAEGRLHVLDTVAGEVVRIEPDGSKQVVGRIEASSGDNLAFDASGRLFVSSFADGWIIEVLGPDEVRIVSPGGIAMPGGVALAGGKLYIADVFGLRELDPNSGEELRVVRGAFGLSDLGSVMSVQPAGSNLVLTSSWDGTVRLWDPVKARAEAIFEGFAQPVDALSLEGDIVVSEYGSGSVVRFDPARPRERVAIASGLSAPAGLAAAGGDLFVAERTTGRILQLVDDGQPLGAPLPVATGLVGPEGIAATAGGTLFVVEVDNARVTRIDPHSRAVTVVAADLEIHAFAEGAALTTVSFNGIAVGENHLYVASNRAGLVYRIGL